jgi:uncharacterized hydrophobic protein (TIGR00271 family)
MRTEFQDFAADRYQLRADDIVAGRAKHPSRARVAAGEGQSCNADSAATSHRRVQSRSQCRGQQITNSHPAADGRDPLGGVHGDTLKISEIDLKGSIGHAEPCIAMAAATDRDGDGMALGKGHAAAHVLEICAAHHRKRATVIGLARNGLTLWCSLRNALDIPDEEKPVTFRKTVSTDNPGQPLLMPGLLGTLRAPLVAGIDHADVVARIEGESGWSARFIFMTLMSAGIAVLGLLLSSPAVVIGAMLISPLMSPILGLGFGLATFDFAEVRRSSIALAGGAALAVLFAALIVLASPLKAPTAEILARTRPNLFDLLVALFAALAGTFAIIRGRGETIVGVAIATALMPPLAVVGYGLATGNMPIFIGSFELFATNFVAIALTATAMARFFGFGHALSVHQSRMQTLLLIFAFVVLAVPLGFALRQIASEAVTVNQVRALLMERFGAQARISQLDVDFARDPLVVRAVVIAPRAQQISNADLRAALRAKLARPISLQLDRVLLAPGADALASQRAENEKAQAANAAEQDASEIARLVALAAGTSLNRVTLDRDHQRATATATPLPGAGLAAYRALEARAAAAADGWDIDIVPPFAALPPVRFADSIDVLDDHARAAVELAAWAARRWNAPALIVPGLPANGIIQVRPKLDERRALAIAAVLKAQNIAAVTAPPQGQIINLRVAPSILDQP